MGKAYGLLEQAHSLGRSLAFMCDQALQKPICPPKSLSSGLRPWSHHYMAPHYLRQ